MSKSTGHVYYDECTLFGIFSWRKNFAVELAEKNDGATVSAEASIAEDIVDGRRGMLVHIKGKGRCFVTDTASVRTTKRYLNKVLEDGILDPREQRVLYRMAEDMLDGRLDGMCHKTVINDAEYRRALRGLQVAA